MSNALLGQKQTSAEAAWATAWETARDVYPDALLDPLLDRTITTIRTEAATRRVGYGWSGGKDSLALGYVMAAAGVGDCVMGMTSGLEYPAMLRWVTTHMPDGLTVRTVPLDLDWLAAHPAMLFPQAERGPRWFTLIQHKVQTSYFLAENLDVLALGRRRRDGNYIGPRGADRYTNKRGITRWAPLADWPHEAVMSLLIRENISLPPCYSWPRGFQVGTGAWPARQWTRDVDHGWCEVWDIDPNVVRDAAARLPSAGDWMRRSEVT